MLAIFTNVGSIYIETEIVNYVSKFGFIGGQTFKDQPEP